MRFPITFKFGIGFLFSGWVLNIFLNSQLAVEYYKNMAGNSVTTAFATAIGKINPTLFQVEGFNNYYSLTPLLICLATGFILSALFCWLIDTFVGAIYTLVHYSFQKLPPFLDGLQALYRELKNSESMQARKEVVLNGIRRAINVLLDDFDHVGIIFASQLVTLLITVHYVANKWPSLGATLSGMNVDKWFSPNYDGLYVIKSILEALFNI